MFVHLESAMPEEYLDEMSEQFELCKFKRISSSSKIMTRRRQNSLSALQGDFGVNFEFELVVKKLTEIYIPKELKFGKLRGFIWYKVDDYFDMHEDRNGAIITGSVTLENAEDGGEFMIVDGDELKTIKQYPGDITLWSSSFKHGVKKIVKGESKKFLFFIGPVSF